VFFTVFNVVLLAKEQPAPSFTSYV
jgi:hypothetical protein